METTTFRQHEDETSSVAARRRQHRVMQVIFAGAATVATLALADQATELPAQTTALSGLQFPQAAPNVAGDRGFAADPSDPGWNPQPDPGVTSQPNPGWSSQSDPGWNADPGWDFQPSP
ncbi:MAG: hypothetical protein WBZ37_27525 [Mycobacterium sp.]